MEIEIKVISNGYTVEYYTVDANGNEVEICTYFGNIVEVLGHVSELLGSQNAM